MTHLMTGGSMGATAHDVIEIVHDGKVVGRIVPSAAGPGVVIQCLVPHGTVIKLGDNIRVDLKE